MLHIRSFCRVFATASLCAPLFWSCTGDIGEEAPVIDLSAGAAVSVFECDESMPAFNSQIRRLTYRQYVQTLYDMLTRLVGDEELGLELREAVYGSINALPDDVRFESAEDINGSYRRIDQLVSQSHVEAWYNIAETAGARLTQADLIERVVGTCAVDGDSSNDASCLSDFVSRVGKWAFRRPITDEELTLYSSFFTSASGEDPQGYADVLAGLLSAPQFIYIIEHGETESNGVAETYELSAYELASRLSYHFWDTMPDEELMAVADSGELLNENEYARQVERLFADDRTILTMQEFFLDWLKLSDVPALTGNNERPQYIAFAGDDLPTPALRGSMIQEMVDMLTYHTFEKESSLETLFLTTDVFPTSEGLAKIYGTEIWDKESDPPTAPERPGILTRAAMLVTGNANTRPIKKGVFIRHDILCDSLGTPPDNAFADLPELSEELSTRQVIENMTESSDSCAVCHATSINPLGFSTENFDGLGRFREEQPLYDEAGELVAIASVNTETVPHVLTGDNTVSNGPTDLMELIVTSGKAEMCFSRQYFRYTFGRFADSADKFKRDGCVLEELRQTAEEGSIRDVLKAIALLPAFKRRSFLEEE